MSDCNEELDAFSEEEELDRYEESFDESIGEEEELEVSCALQDLTVKLNSFKTKMNKELLPQAKGIDEDIIQEESHLKNHNNQRKLDQDEVAPSKKQLPQWKHLDSWDFKQENQHLAEMKGNIAKLLKGIKLEAKQMDTPLDNQATCK